MTAALALWSAFTAVCGLAHGFLALFFARLGVGVGEAGGVARAYALITDYFPPHAAPTTARAHRAPSLRGVRWR
jgi:MFS transporter, Spinster family, sphingosine-1-phosphate transporter